jgi:hypothetical protein
MTQAFTFYDENGAPVSMAVRDVLNMTDCLGYRYDDPLSVVVPDPAPPALTSEDLAAQEVTKVAETPADSPITLAAEPVFVSLTLSDEGDAALTDVAAVAATPVAGAVTPRITLTLAGVQDLGSPGLTYAVFVNPADDTAADSASDAYVGTVSLFLMDAMDHDRQGHGVTQSFDITRAVQDAQERGDWQAELIVSFVPAGLVPADGAATPPVTSIAMDLTGAEAEPGPWVTIEQITVATAE